MELFNQIFKYLTTVWYVWELIEVINFKRWGDLRTDMLNLGHCYELYWLTEVIWTKNSSAGRKVWKLHIQISDLYSNCLFELCFDQICTAWCKKILACSLNLARFYFAQPCIWNFEYFFFYRALNLSCTGSLSHLRIMLPKNSSRPSLPNGPLTQLNSY